MLHYNTLTLLWRINFAMCTRIFTCNLSLRMTNQTKRLKCPWKRKRMRKKQHFVSYDGQQSVTSWKVALEPGHRLFLFLKKTQQKKACSQFVHKAKGLSFCTDIIQLWKVQDGLFTIHYFCIYPVHCPNLLVFSTASHLSNNMKVWAALMPL